MKTRDEVIRDLASRAEEQCEALVTREPQYVVRVDAILALARALNEKVAAKVIAGRSLAEWQEFARRDDCLDQMVPSDLRQIIGAALTPAHVGEDAE